MNATRTNKLNGTSKTDPFFPYYVPADRIAAVLLEWMAAETQAIDTAPDEYGLGRAELLTGIPARSLYRIIHGESATCTFDFADRILCGLGLVGLWHVPKDKGGLADWYEADEDNPLPALPKPTAKQRAINTRANKQRQKKRAQERAELAKSRRAVAA